MALTDTQKTDYLYKLIKSKGHTSTSKAIYEEFFSGVSPQVFSDSMWTESASIPSTPPGATTSIVGVYSDLELTPDPSLGGTLVWAACSTPGDLSTRISRWIPNKFGRLYSVRLYEDDGAGGLGDQIYQGDSIGWNFFEEYGILTVNNVVGKTLPFHIAGYTYVGATGPITGTDDKNYTFTVPGGSPLTTWTMTHNFGKKPCYTVQDENGNVLHPYTVEHLGTNTLKFVFRSATAGEAQLN